MSIVTILLLTGLLIEAVVETVKLAIAGEIKWPYLLAMVLGIGCMLLGRWGFYAALDVAFPWWADSILSGIIVSRGANVISDVIGRVNSIKTNT